MTTVLDLWVGTLQQIYPVIAQSGASALPYRCCNSKGLQAVASHTHTLHNYPKRMLERGTEQHGN